MPDGLGTICQVMSPLFKQSGDTAIGVLSNVTIVGAFDTNYNPSAAGTRTSTS